MIPFLILAYLRLDVDLTGKKTIGEMLSAAKCTEELRSIEYIRANPNHGLYAKYKARKDPSRACKKPIDSIAARKSYSDVRISARYCAK